MARDLNKIWVVDIEATCWEGSRPLGEISEVIEIGLVSLDVSSGEITDPFGPLLIRPMESKVSDFCTSLTTISPDNLKDAPIFAEVIFRLCDLRMFDTTWASYGDYDREMIAKQCSRLMLPNPFGKTHLNIKNLYALRTKSNREVGLQQAMDASGLVFEGIHHRGLDDARNTARLLKTLL